MTTRGGPEMPSPSQYDLLSAMLAWLSQVGLSGTLTGIVIAHVVLATPFAMAICRLRLSQMDPSLEAAAQAKAVAMNAEDERMICTRERKMGSNFTQRVCRTVGQLRREREAARDGLRRADEMQRMQPKQSGSM